MRTNGDLYDHDLYAWTQEQAVRLREGAWHEVDLAHLIEEIEDVGHSQRDALASHLLILLTHLLKVAIAARQRPHDLERAGRGWRTTCRTQRRLTPLAGQTLTPEPQPASYRARGMHGGLRDCPR